MIEHVGKAFSALRVFFSVWYADAKGAKTPKRVMYIRFTCAYRTMHGWC